MKKSFNEHPFFEWMGNAGDWIVLNLLFVVTCIPVVTIGMSLTALYRVALRKIKGECNYPVREFLGACKEEWKKATKLWLIFLFTGGLLGFDILYAEKMWPAVNVGIGCLTILWMMLFSYAFPLQAKFENTIKNTLQNALALAVKNLPFTIIIVALNFIPVLCVLLGVNIAAMALPLYVVFGFSLTAGINCIFFQRIFAKFMDAKGENES